MIFKNNLLLYSTLLPHILKRRLCAWFKLFILHPSSFILLLTGCSYNCIEPEICYVPPVRYVAALPSSFEPPNSFEASKDWAKELHIGNALAREMDFYRAITCFKRSLLLLPQYEVERRQQLEYDIILCYYIGRRFYEAIETFENSTLTGVRSSFPGYRTLLIALYDSYAEVEQCEKAEKILELINQHEPVIAHQLSLSIAIQEGDLTAISAINNEEENSNQRVDALLSCYYAGALSPTTAQTLSALLPGAGYLYVGQRQSAFTAFILNGLSILGSIQAFQHNQIATGILLLGLEAGWYFGGINGAGLAAQQYNEQLYECAAKELLMEEKLFPVLMFNKAF